MKKNFKKRPLSPRTVSNNCSSGKVSFPTEVDAMMALERTRATDWWKKSKKQNPIKRFYQCPECDNWHLTKKRERSFNGAEKDWDSDQNFKRPK